MSNKLKINSFDGLEMLQSHLSNHQYPLHYHDSFCVSLICQGILGENTTIAPAFSLLISHPYEVHKNDVINEIDYSIITFYISADVMKYAADGRDIFFKEKVINDPWLFQAFYQTSQIISDTKTTIYKFDQLFKAALKQFVGHHASCEPYGENIFCPPLSGIKDFIIHNIDKRITLDTLCRMSGKNRYQFIRWFKKNTGLTPFHFIALQRVERGKKMLKEGKPIVHAALDCGFYDQSHFTNYFKYFVGITPKQYQEQCNIFQDFVSHK